MAQLFNYVLFLADGLDTEAAGISRGAAEVGTTTKNGERNPGERTAHAYQEQEQG